MKYNIYSIYDCDIGETSDLFLSKNDLVAEKTFEAYKKRLKENNPYLETNNLMLINLGEYETKIIINKTINKKEVDTIENAITDTEPYFTSIEPKHSIYRLERQRQEVKNNVYFDNLLKKEGEEK